MSRMTEDPWARRRDAFAAGEVTRHGYDMLHDYRVEFADGTVWFPNGGLDPVGSGLEVVPAFALVLLSGVATLVLTVDGYNEVWWAAASLAVSLVLLWLGLARAQRLENAAIARLERGLFLTEDALTVHQSVPTTVSRARIQRFDVRYSRRGEGPSQPWIVVVVENDQVATGLGPSELPRLRAWLEGHSDDPSRGR